MIIGLICISLGAWIVWYVFRHPEGMNLHTLAIGMGGALIISGILMIFYPEIIHHTIPHTRVRFK